MTSERIEPGAEAAHRDDLARDAARQWRAAVTQDSFLPATLPEYLNAALDRLAAAYCTDA